MTGATACPVWYRRLERKALTGKGSQKHMLYDMRRPERSVVGEMIGLDKKVRIPWYVTPSLGTKFEGLNRLVSSYIRAKEYAKAVEVIDDIERSFEAKPLRLECIRRVRSILDFWRKARDEYGDKNGIASEAIRDELMILKSLDAKDEEK